MDEVAQLKAYIKELEENNEILTTEYHQLSGDYSDLLNDLNDFARIVRVFNELNMEYGY